MTELPEQVIEALSNFQSPTGHISVDIERLRRDLAEAGWRLVPETIIPRAGGYAEVASLLRHGAREAEVGGYSPTRLANDADHLERLSAFAAAVLGVDLDDLAQHVEGGEP